MKQRFAFFFIAIFLLGLFTGFSKYVKRGGMNSIDFDVTVKVQDKIPSRFDEFMDDGAILADGIVSSVLTLALTGILLVDRKSAKGGSALGRKLRWGALLIPVMFALFIAIEIYGKNVLPHPGPPFFMIKQPTTIFPKFHVIQPYSYPSGHAGRATFLAIIFVSHLTFHVSRNEKRLGRLGLLAGVVVYVLFVYVSRIYLGHHWLSDIVGGMFLGASLSALAIGFL